MWLQQYLPFTVLKLLRLSSESLNPLKLQQYLPFTVLKLPYRQPFCCYIQLVATVPTACGIETGTCLLPHYQQCFCKLQQYLPLAVLKRFGIKDKCFNESCCVATVPTVYGIETSLELILFLYKNLLVAIVPTACGIETRMS